MAEFSVVGAGSCEPSSLRGRACPSVNPVIDLSIWLRLWSLWVMMFGLSSAHGGKIGREGQGNGQDVFGTGALEESWLLITDCP